MSTREKKIVERFLFMFFPDVQVQRIAPVQFDFENNSARFWLFVKKLNIFVELEIWTYWIVVNFEVKLKILGLLAQSLNLSNWL